MLPFSFIVKSSMHVLIKSTYLFFILIYTSSMFSLPVFASNYGTTGIIELPSARMQDDGTLSFSVSHDNLIESYSITYQAFPWLEGTFRYTGTKEYLFWDRNYELKAQLFQETSFLPQISVGIRDLVGTGVYGSEYLVATKKINNLDISFGIGWGRLSNGSSINNPLVNISDSFETRNNNFGLGGEIAIDNFFSGSNIGLFGGISYRFDKLPITIHAEYNPDENISERIYNSVLIEDSPISYGLTLHVNEDIDLSLSHQHLEHIGLSLKVNIDTKEPPYKFKPSPYISSKDLSINEFPKGFNPSLWYDRLLLDIERADLFLLNAKLKPTERMAEIEIANDQYAYWPDALQKAHELTSLHLPKYISDINYVITEQGHRLHTISLERAKFSQIAEISNSIKILPVNISRDIDHTTSFVKDEIFIDVELDHRLMLFDPYKPLAYQLFANISSKINLPYDWSINTSLRVDIENNIDELKRPSNSLLQRVRSDSLKYLQEGEDGLATLFIEQRSTFIDQPELHYRVFAGILEDMYSGVGAEFLYQPYASRLAFGVSAAYVKQREYNGGLGLLNYQVFTGHASLFWATPYNDYDMALHIGRYLAKDIGATLEIRRTFENGWQIGLWATKTNVSAEQFGEGSFDKGIYFKIPFDSFFNDGKKSSYKTRIRPVLRDGGARLEGYTGEIWWDIRDARFDIFTQSQRD